MGKTIAARVAAAALVVGIALALAATQGWRTGALWLVGAGLGLTLFHAAFGFAGAFRRLLADRRGAGLRAQLVMLGLAAALFLPALEAGAILGQPVRGFVFPIGWALLLGAFLFGVGMQLGGGCASGTLYTAAGGVAPRAWITLIAFIVGATATTWAAASWSDWPTLPPLSLPRLLGVWPALGLTLGALGLAWVASTRLEHARHGDVERLGWHGAFWHGPWPLLWGAIGLAVLNFATLALAGRPWAITAAFPLWGAQAIEALGWDDPAFWPYWEDPTRAEALLRPLWTDRITLMNLGLMAGAALGATLAGRGAAWRWPTRREAAGGVAGGLLLGAGAILAFGCNVSAYFGGIASGSLHGWVWIGPALVGNWVGLRLREASRRPGRGREVPALSV